MHNPTDTLPLQRICGPGVPVLILHFLGLCVAGRPVAEHGVPEKEIPIYRTTLQHGAQTEMK